jgi:hypothetical protein
MVIASLRFLVLRLGRRSKIIYLRTYDDASTLLASTTEASIGYSGIRTAILFHHGANLEMAVGWGRTVGMFRFPWLGPEPTRPQKDIRFVERKRTLGNIVQN